MFPAIFDAIRNLRQGFGSDFVGLGLKQQGVSFNQISAGEAEFLRKFPQIAANLGAGLPAWSGESVNDTTALAHSVVWACRRVISESVAFMPLSMMQQRDGQKQAATKHPVYNALHYAPNDEMSTMTFRETLTDHVVSGGNCYAKIHRRSGTGVAREFELLVPRLVKPDRDKQKRLVYAVEKDKTYTVEPGKPHDLLHIRGLGYDGTRGYSVISMARNSIGSAIAAEKYAGRFYAAGGRVPYVIEMAQRFRTEEDFAKWRADWNKFYASSDNWHQAVVMEPGMVYKQIGLSPEDAQFLETRQFNIPEICRWFLISPHLVGDLSRATFSNIEHLALQFVKMTLTAWITRWEQDLWRCVLTPSEKGQGYYFRHNVNGLLRGDFASRMQGYASMLQNGHAVIDEVRGLEDLNPLPNGAGQAAHIQLNMQTLPGTGTPTAAEQAAISKGLTLNTIHNTEAAA